MERGGLVRKSSNGSPNYQQHYSFQDRVEFLDQDEYSNMMLEILHSLAAKKVQQGLFFVVLYAKVNKLN